MKVSARDQTTRSSSSTVSCLYKLSQNTHLNNRKKNTRAGDQPGRTPHTEYQLIHGLHIHHTGLADGLFIQELLTNGKSSQ